MTGVNASAGMFIVSVTSSAFPRAGVNSGLIAGVMEAMELDLPLNCPRCGESLTYVCVQRDGSQVYVCSLHGEYRLSVDGYLRGGTGPYGRSGPQPCRH